MPHPVSALARLGPRSPSNNSRRQSLYHPCLPDEETEAQRLSDVSGVSQPIPRDLGGTPVVPEPGESKRTSQERIEGKRAR